MTQSANETNSIAATVAHLQGLGCTVDLPVTGEIRVNGHTVTALIASPWHTTASIVECLVEDGIIAPEGTL